MSAWGRFRPVASRWSRLRRAEHDRIPQFGALVSTSELVRNSRGGSLPLDDKGSCRHEKTRCGAGFGVLRDVGRRRNGGRDSLEQSAQDADSTVFNALDFQKLPPKLPPSWRDAPFHPLSDRAAFATRSGDSIRGNQGRNRATGNQRIGLAGGLACIRDHAMGPEPFRSAGLPKSTG